MTDNPKTPDDIRQDYAQHLYQRAAELRLCILKMSLEAHRMETKVRMLMESRHGQ
jgi:hypothetical protein